MSSEIESVVFDLGGVLIDWNPRHVYRELFDGDEERVEWFLTEICSPVWNAQQDAGRTLEEATESLVAEYPQHEDPIRAYYGRWVDMIGGAIEGTVDILAEVRDSPNRLFGLTNWSAETFPTALEMFDFLSWFDGIVVSGQIGLIKPAEPIYEHLIRRFELEPSTTVFIDDSGPNVETARRLGFHAIHFEHPEQLRLELLQLGVKLESSIES